MEGRKINITTVFHEEDCTTKIGKDITKYYLFEKVPNTINFFSPSYHHELKVIREEGQILIFFFNLVNFYSIYNLEKMKTLREKCKEKYSNKVKIVYVGITFCELYYDYDNEKEHFTNFEECLFLYEKYQCVFQTKGGKGLIYIDSNGVIQLIEGMNGFRSSKYIDEKDIMTKIDLLVNNKPLIRIFNKEEYDKWNKELINFCSTCQYDFEEVFSGLKIIQHVLKGDEKDTYFNTVFINVDYVKDPNKVNEALRVLSSFFQKYIDDGVNVSTAIRYKKNKLSLKRNDICYKCKKAIDPSLNYSYLCIKCTNEGVIKQYCSHCVSYFNTFKTFGPQMTLLNDIEEYNKYLNNHTLDDKPCNNAHLLLFIPQKEQFVENGNSNYQDVFNDEKDISFFTDLPTYLEYSSPSRSNQKCLACGQLSKYESESSSRVIDYRSYSFDNSLYDYYTNDGLYREMRHLQRTLGNYTPNFYCPICRLYFDWECFVRMNLYIRIQEHELFDYQYFRHDYEKDYIDKNEYFEYGKSSSCFGFFDEETINAIHENEGLTKESIENIKDCYRKRKIEIAHITHKVWHPCIIIQGKGVRLTYSDFEFPTLYRNINK